MTRDRHPSPGSPQRPVARAPQLRTPTPRGILAIYVVVGVLVVGILGYTLVRTAAGADPSSSLDVSIDGVVDVRATEPEELTRDHMTGTITYARIPPVGGNHNPIWQNCNGDVYAEPIAAEHAAHSLEHGAVWITYRSGLAAVQVEVLAGKVTGRDYLLMSPVPELATPVSVQAWGFQLAVESVDDPRIEEFITAYRIRASMEPGASCGGGRTDAGTTPRDPTDQAPSQ